MKIVVVVGAVELVENPRRETGRFFLYPPVKKPGDVLVDKWKRVFPLHHLVEAGWWNVENSVGKVEKSEALPFPVDHRGRWKRGELPVISRWEPGGISVETGRKTTAGR